MNTAGGQRLGLAVNCQRGSLQSQTRQRLPFVSMMRPAVISASCLRRCERSRPHSLRSSSAISRPNLPSQVISLDEPGTLKGGAVLVHDRLAAGRADPPPSDDLPRFSIVAIDFDEVLARRVSLENMAGKADPLVTQSRTRRQKLRLISTQHIPLGRVGLPPAAVATPYFVVQTVHVGDQVLATFAGGIEQRDLDAGNRLLQFVLPFLDQVVWHRTIAR